MKLREKSPVRRRMKRKPKILALPERSKIKRSALNPEQILARQEEVFRLRIDEGMTFREIANIIGVAVSTVEKDLNVICRLKYSGLIEKNELVLLEDNARYDQIISNWSRLLKPLLDEDIVIGDTKRDRQGNEYDITIPAYEAAKTATEALLKAMAQREKLNGFTDNKRPIDAKELSEELTMGVLTAMQKLARQPVKAELTEGKYPDAEIPAHSNN